MMQDYSGSEDRSGNDSSGVVVGVCRIADILQLDVSGEYAGDASLVREIQRELDKGQRRFVVNVTEVPAILDAAVSDILEARDRILSAGGYFALALPERLLPKHSGWRGAPFRFEAAQEAVESLLRE